MFYLEIRRRRGLQRLIRHLFSYGYLAWANGLSSFVSRLNGLVKSGRSKSDEKHCETLMFFGVLARAKIQEIMISHSHSLAKAQSIYYLKEFLI